MIGRMAYLLERVDFIIFANERQNAMRLFGRGRDPEALQGTSLQHPRQPRKPCAIHVVCDLLWAVGGDLAEPVDQLGVAATLLDRHRQMSAYDPKADISWPAVTQVR